MYRTSLAGLIAILVAAPASATLIIDTGPGAIGSGQPALFRSPRSFQSLASEFVLTEAHKITSIRAYTNYDQLGGSLTAVIMANDGSSTPGAVLHSVAFMAPDGEGWFGPAGLNWDLDAAAYWIGYVVEVGQTYNGSIAANAPNPLRRDIVNNPSLFWEERNRGLSWQIEGSPVSTGGVPEPAIWAMLIAGFGLTGAAMRRRRSAAVAA
jgi:hypothetical protein